MLTRHIDLGRWLLTALLLLALQAHAADRELHGHVVRIVDGDTLVLLVDHEQHRIRLADIDTPERGQPWGTRAKDALTVIVGGQEARVVVTDVDRYGREIGRVYIGEVDVNAEMVRQGDAWVYRRYSRDPALLEVEAEARAEKRGLWGLPEAERVAPWNWRKAH